MKTSTTTLIRMLRAGEVLSFDQGRIKIELVEKTGRTARLRLILGETVVVDKPRASANDASYPGSIRGLVETPGSPSD